MLLPTWNRKSDKQYIKPKELWFFVKLDFFRLAIPRFFPLFNYIIGSLVFLLFCSAFYSCPHSVSLCSGHRKAGSSRLLIPI